MLKHGLQDFVPGSRGVVLTLDVARFLKNETQKKPNVPVCLRPQYSTRNRFKITCILHVWYCFNAFPLISVCFLTLTENRVVHSETTVQLILFPRYGGAFAVVGI